MLKDQDKSPYSGTDYSKNTNLTEVNGDVEMLSGGDMVARALEEEGVEFIFGYPGGAVLHIYDALHRHCSVPLSLIHI